MKDYTNTGIRILETAKILFAQQGYNAVSTKLIAKTAQVNEVTLFRNFGSKENLFEKVIEYFLFKPKFKKLMSDEFKSLEQVLIAFGNFLHTFFKENLNIILMELRMPTNMKRRQRIGKFPTEVKNQLAMQFVKYQKIEKSKAQLNAVCFMTSLYGVCFNLYVLKTITKQVTFQKCLENIVEKYG